MNRYEQNRKPRELLRATVFGRSVWNAALIRNETADAQTAVIWRCHHPFGRQASLRDPKLGTTPHRPTLMSEMTYR
jgi:hypothetical protein